MGVIKDLKVSVGELKVLEVYNIYVYAFIDREFRMNLNILGVS
jgi:hypothetical protein